MACLSRKPEISTGPYGYLYLHLYPFIYTHKEITHPPPIFNRGQVASAMLVIIIVTFLNTTPASFSLCQGRGQNILFIGGGYSRVMASAVTRAHSGSLGAMPPVRFRGKACDQRARGQSPPEAESNLKTK